MHGKEKRFTDTALNPITKYAVKRYQRPFFADYNANVAPQLQALSRNTLTAEQAAAANPAWAQAQQRAGDIATGKLVANPYLEQSIASSRKAMDAGLAGTREASGADEAGKQAAIASNFARNGQTFSTANQQAAQADQAALDARLAESENAARAGFSAAADQTRMQDYAAAPGRQDAAIEGLNKATSAPLNYLSQAQQTAAAPSKEYSDMLTKTFGGPSANTAIYNTKGLADWMSSGMSSL